MQAVENHKILQRTAGHITDWNELRELGLELGSDPNDIKRLECTMMHDVETAAYKILSSFYNRSEGPHWKTWTTIKGALNLMGKNAAVTELGLDRLSREKGMSGTIVPNGQF